MRFAVCRRVCVLLVLAAVFAVAIPGEPLAPEPRYSVIAERAARFLPAKHLSRAALDDGIAARTWTNYLSTLDYEHLYFLKSDIERFAEARSRIDDMLLDGELAFAYDVFEVFKRRVAERCDFIAGLLADGFDLDRDEVYTVRDRSSRWPESAEERDELWRRKIKNEYLRQIIARDAADAAATNAVPEAPSATNAVSGDASGEPDAASAPDLSPEEYVMKRYRQMHIILEDSDAEWVLQRYLSAFTQAYDPHSGYMTQSSVEDFNIEMRLSLVGIGALLRAEDGAAKIVRLIPGGPAARDKSPRKLRPGDKIIAVAQEGEAPVDILHWPLYRVVRLIRGEKGTRVRLTVIPASDRSGSVTKEVVLVRDEVELEEQAASSEVRTVEGPDGGTRKLGIIELPAFYANMQARSVSDPDYRSAAQDVARALADLRAEDVDGVLLDLRNNGGGSLLEAIRLVGLFIRTGPAVMVKERSSLRVLPDDDPTVAYGGPLVVLVNRLSASASEIVAGALQDYERAVIVGDSKTHGKGTVQTILRLGLDRSLGSVKVTTASYYRISGSSTQLRGVTPDIVLPSAYDPMEIGEEFLPSPMDWSMVQRAKYEPLTDLGPAIEALRTRSEARRAADPRYAVYRKMLRRIEEMTRTRQIPLRLEERRAIAAAEEELTALQDQLMAEQDEDEEDGDTPDLVLEEALRVLAGLTDYEEARLKPALESTTSAKNLPQLIQQMLESL